MGCSLYVGLEACAQLKVATCRLCLVPRFPHNKFSQGPAERLPYSHGVHPWPFIKSHQAKTACVNLQLCAGLEASIEKATHVVGQRILERERARKSKEVAGSMDEEEDNENMEGLLNDLSIETAKKEEEAADRLEAVPLQYS